MNQKRLHVHVGIGIWALGLMAILFLSSCAGLQEPRQSQVPRAENRPPIVKEQTPVSKERPLPAANLPQIGTRQASISRERPRPDILVNLIKKAEQQIQSKELDPAYATLERALGIDAQDPLLWHLMAKVKLSQGNLQQAEHLAKKSNLLAAHTPSLQKKNWGIIARALDLQGRTREAEAAQKKAGE